MHRIKILKAKFLFFLLLTAAAATSGYSQTISRSVISSGGRYISTGTSGLYANVAEVVITTLENGNIFTQGFVQPPNPLVTTIPENETPPGSPYLYPNPAKENVQVTICESCKLLSLELYDYQGRKLSLGSSLQKLSGNTYNLNVSTLSNGMYIVKILDSGDKDNFRTIRLIKAE